MGNLTFSKQLAASVLLSVFDDLASPDRTKYVYASFFDTDYCKALFDCAGIAYDRFIINARIAQRPRMPVPENDTYTRRFVQRVPSHAWKRGNEPRKIDVFICVENGYITRIEDKHGNLFRLFCKGSNGTGEKECSYYAKTAFNNLNSGRYKLKEGV